ncbi:MAG: nucleotidyltransferase domain-containing protein [Nanoarchaeota archaeon]
MNQDKILNNKLINELKKDKRIIAVLLFGSRARNEQYRDTDICLVLDKKYSNLEMSKIVLKYSSELTAKHDIQVFQQLPLYIRQRILKEGKILLCINEPALYDIAFATIKEFEYYKKIYYTYLEAMQK